MKIGINIGHYGTKGAMGILDEERCNTAVYNALAPLLQSAGHEVIPCNVATPPDYISATKYANKQNLDLLISIHHNASVSKSAHGTEVMYYTGNAKTRELAQKLSKSISDKLGTHNRGAVPRNNLYILNNTSMPCVLVEGLFVDNKRDADKWDAQKIAFGIAEVFGYVGKPRYSYDDTVNNMILDGVTTTQNMGYWEKVLDGRETVNGTFLREILNRYSKKLSEK